MAGAALASARMKPDPDVLFQEVEGEVVLLDPSTDKYFALNDVGTRCWQLLAEHGDLEEVLARMLDEFEVEEPTLRADVEALVAKLSAHGLVVPSDPPR
jgi:Coenzyme PQQ synthesis protein D (PqqD)